ncbi:MAG: nodulation protein NfeD [candidate division NC10 bacterium]|nr:nodulation protein NfeD [candidate division NC10 bacterium]
MRKGGIFLLGIWLLILLLPGGGAAEENRFLMAVRIEGIISASTSEFMVSAIHKAQSQGAEALVIELDTPGGLDISMRQILKEMLSSRVPIIVYVSPSGARAASAGVFITIAAHIAAMAPGTNIGAAHPVSMGGEKMDKEMANKVANDAAAYLRSISEQRGRNAKWAEDAVRKSVSATEREALSLHVIDLISPSLEDLLQQVDGRSIKIPQGTMTLRTKDIPVRRVEMSFRDKVLRVISDPTIAYIFLILGFYGLFFELSNPGSILPGIVGGIFLILAFFAFQSLPVNYAGLLLILFAMILFLAEVKVMSHGLLTAGGIISMLLGSLMLVQSPIPSLSISRVAILVAVLATAGFFVFVVAKGLGIQLRKPTTGKEGLVGEIGVARTRLDPEGQIAVRGEIWTAWCDEAVEVGEKVRVVEVVGLKLKVEKV